MEFVCLCEVFVLSFECVNGEVVFSSSRIKGLFFDSSFYEGSVVAFSFGLDFVCFFFGY